MARYVERCRDCSPGTTCRWHGECATHNDARIAAEIGRLWARWVWNATDKREPWPSYDGRCADIALRKVSWLAHDDARRGVLGGVCCWQASITWEALQSGMRDAPFRAPSNQRNEFDLLGSDDVRIRFRPRDVGITVPLTRRALVSVRERAGRFRAAQGLRADDRDQVERLTTRNRTGRR
jgi:hypothetical protein